MFLQSPLLNLARTRQMVTSMSDGYQDWTQRVRQLSARLIDGAVAPFCAGVLATGLPLGVAARADGSILVLAASALPGLGGLALLLMARRGGPGPQASGHEDRVQALETEARTLRAQLAELDDAAEERRIGAMQAMADAIEHKVDEKVQLLGDGVQRVKAISDSIAAVAERSGQNAVMSSEAADHSVESATQLSETAENLNISIRAISAQVEQATGAVGAALRASADAREAIAAMTGNITTIQSVADLIQTIAGQTNMLALNAMIEAARAGEAGRGFAVVANEVKELARMTTQSAQSIAGTIGAIDVSNQDVVKAVDRMANAVAVIDQIAQGIAEAVTEQHQATADIAGHVRRTVEAAAALSERIVAMTGDVGSSFECAADVHMAASQVADVTDGLIQSFRQSVSFAVRTSASEVNRRRSDRIPVEMPWQITLESPDIRDAMMKDLSETGARLVLPEGLVARNGMRGRFALPGGWPAGSVAFEVVNVAEADGQIELRLAFDAPFPIAQMLADHAA